MRKQAKPSDSSSFLVRLLAQHYNILFKPEKTTSESMSVKESILLYYKLAILPFVLFLIVGAIFSDSATNTSQVKFLTDTLSFLYTLFIGNLRTPFSIPFTGLEFVLFVGVFYIFILYPIDILLFSGLFHWGGKRMLKKMDEPYRNTLSAFVYGEIPSITFIWLLMLPLFSYMTATLWYNLVMVIWSLFVFFDAIKNQQNLSIPQVVSVGFGTIMWILMFMIVALVVTWIGAGGVLCW
ncbi:MAG: hypothetical protein ABSD68_01695 [Candidatus Micrarchaeales archaeon]